MEINKLLRSYREANGYTQQKVSEILEVSRVCVTNFELGRRSSLKIFIGYLKYILTKEQIKELMEVIRTSGSIKEE